MKYLGAFLEKTTPVISQDSFTDVKNTTATMYGFAATYLLLAEIESPDILSLAKNVSNIFGNSVKGSSIFHLANAQTSMGLLLMGGTDEPPLLELFAFTVPPVLELELLY